MRCLTLFSSIAMAHRVLCALLAARGGPLRLVLTVSLLMLTRSGTLSIRQGCRLGFPCRVKGFGVPWPLAVMTSASP